MSNITIKINTDNAAFEDNPAELKEILNKALKIVQSGIDCGRLMDSNGNTVGNINIEKTLKYLDIEDNSTDLKKHPDGGFYKLEGRLIHYYDDHKNFETTKININKI